MNHFRVASRREGATAFVQVAGELDGAATAAVTAAVEDAARNAERSVVVDVSAVTYAGSAVVRALIAGRDCARRRGVGWRVDGAPRSVRRVVELCRAPALVDGLLTPSTL